MAENKFEIGDVVHLNSGSPDMTVEDVFPKTNNVQTCWFNEVGEKRIAVFHPDCLHLVLTDEEIMALLAEDCGCACPPKPADN